MNYGSTFRKMRLYKGYSLEFVATGIVSVSYLSKFERNESEITLPKIIELLNRINVKFDEFLFVNNQYKRNDIELLIENLKKAYLQGNIKLLNNLFETENTKFKNSGLLTYKLNGIMVQAISCDLNKKKIDKKDIEILVDYLWSVEIWGEYEIMLYGNTLHILDIDSVIMLSFEILKKSVLYKKMTSYRRDMYGLYFNTIRICIEYKRIKEAELFLNSLENEDMQETFVLEKILLKFYQGILQMHTDFNKGLEKANGCIQIFKDIDAVDHVVNYKAYLDNITKKLLKPII